MAAIKPPPPGDYQTVHACPVCASRVDVTIDAEVSGRDRGMRWGPDGGSPPEYAEADILGVYISETGYDITEMVDPDAFSDAVLDQAAENEASDRADAAERAADARRDR